MFFIVSAGDELTGIRVADADQKSSVQIAAELNQRVAEIDEGDDPGLGRGKALLARLPHRLVRPALRLAAWLTSDLNLDLSRFGLPRQAFGGAMITSVGMWGVTRAFSPLAGYYRVPVLAARQAAVQGPAHPGSRERPGQPWLFDDRWGVDAALPAAAPLVSLLEEAAGVADTVGLIRLSAAGGSVIETSITEQSGSAGRSLAKVTLPPNTVVATFVHDGQPAVPSPQHWLRPGDTLLVVTSTATEREVHDAFQ